MEMREESGELMLVRYGFGPILPPLIEPPTSLKY